MRKTDVDVRDLFIAKQLSMHPDRYFHGIFQAIVAKQLSKEGLEVSGRQKVRYLITDSENRMANSRVKVAELVNDDVRFDTKKYVDMLILAGANILSTFGYTEEKLKDKIVYGQK